MKRINHLIKKYWKKDVFVVWRRFNPTLTTPGTNSPEWEAQNMRSTRNFIRKWGHFCKHDALMKPIIPPKYNIAFVVQNCNYELLTILEPWCDRIYIDDEMQVLTSHYLDEEQQNTLFDLNKRIMVTKYNYPIGENDIVVEFDGTKLNNNNFNLIQQFSEIIKDSGEVGKFELDIFKITINKIESLTNNLIFISK